MRSLQERPAGVAGGGGGGSSKQRQAAGSGLAILAKASCACRQCPGMPSCPSEASGRSRKKALTRSACAPRYAAACWQDFQSVRRRSQPELLRSRGAIAANTSSPCNLP